MIIRKATMNDMKWLIPLYQGSLATMAHYQPREYRLVPQDIEFVQMGIVEENADVLVAEENGQIIGLASVFYEEICPKPFRVAFNYVDLDTLYVSECYRRKGVGTALFQAAQQWAKERNAQSLQLMTLGENEPARRFYESMGMRELNVKYIQEF